MRTDFIASTKNPRVKAISKLRTSRGRREAGLIIIDGCREITLALAGGVRLQELYVCPECEGGPDVTSTLAAARSAGVPVVEVSQAVLKKIGYGDRTDELVATAFRPDTALARFDGGANGLVCVVEAVEKPGNLGAILRSAEGAGADAVVVVDAATDVFGPNAIRASLGTIFCVPLFEATPAEMLARLRQDGYRILAASPDAAQVYTSVDCSGPTAIVLGSEARGLSETWRGASIVQARVPMRGRCDSLNISATASLFLYEVLRQRGVQSHEKNESK